LPQHNKQTTIVKNKLPWNQNSQCDPALKKEVELNHFLAKKYTKNTGYNGFGGGHLKPPIEAEAKRFCSQFSRYLDLFSHSAGHLYTISPI